MVICGVMLCVICFEMLWLYVELCYECYVMSLQSCFVMMGYRYVAL